jgi:low affinity Fe/Cu permease
MNELFTRFACAAAHYAGRPWVFVASLALILLWAFTGPYFEWSDSHSLWINTVTTIVTFLLAFLIAATQNRDTAALNAKLDAIIRGLSRVSNEMMDVDNLSEDEIVRLREALRGKGGD